MYVTGRVDVTHDMNFFQFLYAQRIYLPCPPISMLDLSPVVGTYLNYLCMYIWHTHVVAQILYVFFYIFKHLHFFLKCTQWQCNLSFDKGTAMYKFLKALHPGRVRTPDLLFSRWTRCPICHVARAACVYGFFCSPFCSSGTGILNGDYPVDPPRTWPARPAACAGSGSGWTIINAATMLVSGGAAAAQR
jgi:hypothetical protein